MKLQKNKKRKKKKHIKTHQIKKYIYVFDKNDTLKNLDMFKDYILIEYHVL